MVNKTYIVGITGGSASGKTKFLQGLLKSMGTKLCVISQDDYYFPKEHQPVDSNGIKNFDTPQSIDLEAFVVDLKKIASGNVVTRQEYTFNNAALQPKTIVYKPAPIIVVEGLFVLYHKPLAEMLNLSIFIDALEEAKVSRRIQRDKEERGYDLEDVLYRYKHHVSPCYENYIKPFKEEADIIIPNNKDFNKGLEVLIAHLENKMAR